ncbi:MULTISPECIES: helix-turn-helix domain-containing protein [Enterococcus]|uniref:HTH cro/C1-type domain-containing protein n=1 Tax=Candidatus Enterococcus ferrettii TaxID=2815324 RepID=A0ABV0EQP1_9ENTE|nr:helix-turn-helix transcriptional regulator [Enterococcus sp. 665A]MBO1339737.1 helix-turn-helix transcriptional regulator [Enterococcus sp. 665A]
MIKIGSQLKYYREENQFTQKDVAAVLHVTPQTISKWERNKSYPDVDQLVRLSELYKVNVNKLIGRAKPSFLDYLANAQNLRNYYNLPNIKEDEHHGE